MFHHIQLGFFDLAALRNHSIVATKRLDMELANRLFIESGGVIPPGGPATIDGCMISQDDAGYLTCEIPVRHGKAVEFIARLARETGCDIAYAEGGGAETPESFLASYRANIPPDNPDSRD